MLDDTMKTANYGPTDLTYLTGITSRICTYQSDSQYGNLQVLEPEIPELRPLEESDSLADRIFGTSPKTVECPGGFLTEKASLERQQIELLLHQLSARHAISAGIRNEVEGRELDLLGRLDNYQASSQTECSQSKGKNDIEKRLMDVERERRMEAVGLWRDSQKLLTELMRHWTAYVDTARKARVIDDGV